uniref:Uncharacterized protein AlNc14C90G5668 n=1 Tax=Albugo laibachii Nc14 TaxID=890382 RepID=F0WGD6_9STRA|nr:conserved hypothetical protein [Albugo laibachii Nc14]|eukprot:CCA20297.1 conserved hypothetical protein [Albugo laibachii Nc14]
MNQSKESIHQAETGIISVQLGQVYAKRILADDLESSESAVGSGVTHGQPFWATIEIKHWGIDLSSAAFWFTKEDENVYTKIMKVPSSPGAQKEDLGMYMFDFEYDQLSKRIPVTWSAMDQLFGTELVISLYSGDQRRKEADQLVGSSSLGLQELVLSQSAPKCVDNNHTEKRLQFSSQDSLITVVAMIQFSINVLDYIMGLRMIRFHSITVESLPPQWTTTVMEQLETTQSVLKESELDASTFTLEIDLPHISNELDHNTGDSSSAICKSLEGGRMRYLSKVFEGRKIEDDADVEPKCGPDRRIVVTFEDALTFQVHPRELASFIEYIRIQKYAPARLLRKNTERTDPFLEITRWTLSLNLTELLIPGCKKFTSLAEIRSSHVESREFFEKRLASASSQDERKQWQSALNDYENMTMTAESVFESMRKLKTCIAVIVEISPSSLFDEAIQVEVPTIHLHELLPTKSQDPNTHGKESNAIRQLHAEIRQIILLLMQKYCNFMQHEDSDLVPFEKLTRLEKRQSLIYELNTEGIYHQFKEGLRARILPIIQEHFDSIVYPESASHTSDHKLQMHGQVFLLCMENMNTVIKDLFSANCGTSLAHEAEASVSSINEVELKIVEMEYRGNILGCEGVYLDHIRQLELLMDDLNATDTSDQPILLAEAWHAYGCFCLRHDDFTKAVANFEQSLQLNSESVITLLTYASLLIELREASRAEEVLRLVVHLCRNEGYTILIIAHALRAYCYELLMSSDNNSSSHLEMLYAQNLKSMHEKSQSVCAASVWLQVAQFVKDMHLSQLSDAVLKLMKESLHDLDILNSEERILYRLLESDVCMTNGEFKVGKSLLQEALDIDQANAKTWMYHGRLHVRLNNIERAIESFKSVLPIRNLLDVRDRLTVFLSLGNLLLQCSRMEEAKCVFLLGCSEFSIASSWIGVGIAYYRLEMFEEAKLALAEANRLDSRNAEIWGYLALVYYSDFSKSQRSEERLQADTNARRCLNQAIRYNLSNALLLRELSNACVASDHLQDAERLLRRSLIFQDSYLTRNILADVLMAQNFAEGALEQYKASLTNDVTSEERQHLSKKCFEMLKALGRLDEAEAYIRMHDEIKATNEPSGSFSCSPIAESQVEI